MKTNKSDEASDQGKEVCLATKGLPEVKTKVKTTINHEFTCFNSGIHLRHYFYYFRILFFNVE